MMFPFVREALCHLFSKPSTERYPFRKKDTPEGYRGKIAFYPKKCIDCGLCIKVCATAAITKTIEKTEKGDLITMSFDMASCSFCQMCADFCVKSAIEMTREFSMVAEDANDLVVSGTFVKTLPVKKVAKVPKPMEIEALGEVLVEDDPVKAPEDTII